MGLRIEITVTSTNQHAGARAGTHDEVCFTQTYDGIIDGNGRYDADSVLDRGQSMLVTIARQLTKLSELDGGALFTHEDRAQVVGLDARSVR